MKELKLWAVKIRHKKWVFLIRICCEFPMVGIVILRIVVLVAICWCFCVVLCGCN